MTEQLAAAARERSRQCLTAVKKAVSEAKHNGSAVSLKGIAAAAGVSRAYIYSTPDALALVQNARAQTQGRRSKLLVNPRRKSSDESLQTRLFAALTRVDELQRENDRLRAEHRALVQEVVDLQNPPDQSNVVALRRPRF